MNDRPWLICLDTLQKKYQVGETDTVFPVDNQQAKPVAYDTTVTNKHLTSDEKGNKPGERKVTVSLVWPTRVRQTFCGRH